jgi:hypothetical protein
MFRKVQERSSMTENRILENEYGKKKQLTGDLAHVQQRGRME